MPQVVLRAGLACKEYAGSTTITPRFLDKALRIGVIYRQKP